MTELYNIYPDLEVQEDKKLLDKVVSSSSNYLNLLLSHENKKKHTYTSSKKVSDYINIPSYQEPQKKPLHYFQVLQEWEGYISELSETSFTAMLLDITANDNMPNEEADFDLNDVNDEDQFHIKEGAVFRWVVGYYRSKSGSKRRASEIVFRRMSPWSKQEIEKANKETEKFKKIIWN